MGKQQLEFQLYEITLEEICKIETLTRAFKSVKRNKGAPGIDGKTIKEYEENLQEELEELQREVLNWTYKPTPVKRVEIPKPGGGGIRLLGIPIVKDRVLHMAIKMVIEPTIDPTFSNNSYGFRPNRNQRQAVESAQKIVQSGKEHVVDIDLSKFFDRINHDKLIHNLKTHIKDKRILRLIGMILRGGIMSEGNLIISKEGSVQGSPLSPLLSNVVLDELDKELEKRDLEFCRYADDCNIFVKTPRAAERVLKSLKKFIEKKLKLKVNDKKSKAAKADKIKFLGMTIVNGTIAISRKAIQAAMDMVKELIPRGTHIPIERAMVLINRWYRGWASYFKMTQYPSQLYKIEAHIRRRLRARFVKQQKKPKHLCNKLKQLGVSDSLARRTAYSNRKPWAMSHTRGLEKAYSVKDFIEKFGQKILSDREEEHWFGIGKWVKLT